MKRFSGIVAAVSLLVLPAAVFGQFPQGFEGPAGLVTPLPTGWVTLNVSPGGPGTNPDWQQRTDGAVFTSHGGIGYAFANFNSSTGTNPISNYMMTPEVTLENGAIIRFWTRGPTGSGFPDRMVLTYSTNGASTNPADFANIGNVTFHNLVDINPTLTVGGYPEVWTQFVSPPLTGLAGPTQGRIAFWYFVQTSAGPLGVNSNYIGVDDVEYIPPGATTGACCTGAGSCSQTTPAACNAPDSTFFGLASDCAAVSCTGKCCQPNGFCADLGPAACTGAGFTFGGLGSACNPNTPAECIGRCCLPDGSCLEDGPDPCTANGGTFGGVAVPCGDGSACIGRCCVGNTCTPNQNPNQCAAAGGAITLGGSCESFTIFNYVTSVAIPDGLAGGGLGAAAQNVQNVAGVTGNITDLNVDLKINHTWVGDLVVEVEHLGTIVTVVDLMGHAAFDCAGCGSDNIDVILDDEGIGGPIENQCNATAPAALSPPNFTPANPLSGFDGLNPNGDWTLRVRDGCAADIGTIVGWSLHFQNTSSPCAPSCSCKGDLDGSGTVNGADINKFAQCVASGGGAGCACADINGGGVNASDVAPFVAGLLSSTACIP